MASKSAGSRSSMLVLQRDSSPTPASNGINKNLRKLNDLWAKYKNTPPNIAFLVKDLLLLSSFISNGLTDPRYRSSIPPVIQAAIRLCSVRSQELLDVSGRYTGRLSRKALVGDRLHTLESLLGDTKVKFLCTQLLIERREKPISQSALAEELAVLHARDASSQPADSSPNPQQVDAKTDSLLSFKCYSELVGRENILLNLDSELEDNNAVALVGPNGSGKSQIVSECCMRFQNRYPDSRVLWVHCESRVAFEESYRIIATKLSIPGADDYRADVLERVRRYLCQEKAGRWFLILENLDDPQVVWGTTTATEARHTEQSVRLGTYLPLSKLGRTLCVSSDAHVASNFPEAPATVAVECLHDTEATILFQSKLPRELDVQPITTALAKTLEGSPLAICLAASYIVMMRCGPGNYLYLQKAEFPIKLPEASVAEEQPSASNTIPARRKAASATSVTAVTARPPQICPSIKAWTISYAQVQKQNRAAADLLAFMAMFYYHAIPKNLMYHAWKHNLVRPHEQQRDAPSFDPNVPMPSPAVVSEDETDTYLQFSMALATLEAFLLVQYDASREMYSMHRVVQSSTQKFLERNNTLQLWRSNALMALAAACQPLRTTNNTYSKLRSNLILHVSDLLRYTHVGHHVELAKARVLCDVASWKFSTLQYRASTVMYGEAYRLQKALLKSQDAQVVRTLFNLAESTTYSDCPAAAIPMLIDAVSGLKHTLGPGNRRTISALLMLCSNHISSGHTNHASTVHYEAQAAVSASLQISSEDRQRISLRLVELGTQISLLRARQNRLYKSRSTPGLSEDLHKKSRVGMLRQDGHRDRRRHSSKAFSSQSRVASLDSICELREVEPQPS